MAEVSASDIPQEQTFMKDFWDFRKKFYNGEDSDDYWNSIVEETDRISKRYNSIYVDNLLLCCVEDIEVRFNKSNGRPINELELFNHIVEVIKKGRQYDHNS